MRRRLAPASPVVRVASTADPVAAGRGTRGRIAFATLVLAATVLAGAPVVAQVVAPDDGDLTDPLRPKDRRPTSSKSSLVRPSGRAATPLRGSLDMGPDPIAPGDPPSIDGGLGAATLDSIDPTSAPPARPPTLVRVAPTADTDAPAATATAPGPRTDPVTGRPLPAADTTRASTGAVRPSGPSKDGGPIPPRPAIQPQTRDAQAEARQEATRDDDEYTQLGLRTGGFTWLPAVEGSAGWNSNIASRAGGASGMSYRLAPELLGRSDWSRHSLEFDLRGAYLGNTRDSSYDKPSVAAALRGRIDLGDETRVDVKGGYSYDRQSPSATDNPAITAVPATVASKTGSLGVTRDVGIVALTLRGDVERTDYSGGTTTSGTSLGSEVQNNTRWIGAFRATLGSKGSLRPFVELQASKRDYDAATISGQPRDTTGGAVKAGVVADLGPMLRGELSTGWGVERPDKGPLSDISGWLLDGSLVWSPTRLTVVKLDARTSFDPTTLSGSPGSVSRSLALGIDQSLRRDLVASAGVAVTDRRYVSATQHDDAYALNAGLTYKIDRNIQTFVKGTLDHFVSSNSGSNYDAATVMVGIRLQR